VKESSGFLVAHELASCTTLLAVTRKELQTFISQSAFCVKGYSITGNTLFSSGKLKESHGFHHVVNHG
jgi:hypothetical protein